MNVAMFMIRVVSISHRQHPVVQNKIDLFLSLQVYTYAQILSEVTSNPES